MLTSDSPHAVAKSLELVRGSQRDYDWTIHSISIIQRGAYTWISHQASQALHAENTIQCNNGYEIFFNLSHALVACSTGSNALISCEGIISLYYVLPLSNLCFSLYLPMKYINGHAYAS